MKFSLKKIGISALAAMSISPGVCFAAESNYLQIVRSCLDTLIDKGTDRYGSEHSPMFSSILTLDTQRMPDVAPPLLPGQRANDRAFPGANLQHDLHTLILLREFSRLTGDSKYSTAADAYMGFFLKRCAAWGNGLLPYGEHAFWNFRTEEVQQAIQENLGLVPPDTLEWMWSLNPAAVEKHIRRLEIHFLAPPEVVWDPKTADLVWNRHAGIKSLDRPKEPAAFPRAGGFFITEWGFLHTKKPDRALLDISLRTARASKGTNMSLTSLGICLLRTNAMLQTHAVPEFASLGKQLCDRILDDPEDHPSKGIIGVYTKVFAGARTAGSKTFGFWDLTYAGSGGYGALGAERYALMATQIHRLTGSPRHLELAREIGEFYLQQSIPKDEGISCGKFGGMIALMLDLHDLTRDPRYLRLAEEIAETAASTLYANGLIRAATGADYYEAANGAGILLTELLRLHLIISGVANNLPRCYNDI
jgi:hypothetical protein